MCARIEIVEREGACARDREIHTSAGLPCYHDHPHQRQERASPSSSLIIAMVHYASIFGKSRQNPGKISAKSLDVHHAGDTAFYLIKLRSHFAPKTPAWWCLVVQIFRRPSWAHNASMVNTDASCMHNFSKELFRPCCRTQLPCCTYGRPLVSAISSA